MIFEKHLELRGKHALFPPSKPSWLNYSIPKMFERIDSENAKTVGTLIHEYAASQIYLNHRVTNKKTLIQSIENYIYDTYYNDKTEELSQDGIIYIDYVAPCVDRAYETIKNYINDSIGFKMTPEQPLKYSDRFFGHADAISFRDQFLRIHDLKTGVSPVKMEQLIIYAALFCLNYNVKPGEMQSELRIYQNNEIVAFTPEADDILPVMDHIVTFDKAYSKKRL